MNVGSYRVMVHDACSVGVLMLPGSHGRLHYEKWWDTGRPAPMAISLGHDPRFSRSLAVLRFLLGFLRSTLQAQFRENP